MDACTRRPGGAEVELSMLFVDVRGSTTLAEQMSPREFSRLMNRFYKAATAVLIKTDAFIDKLVGDEVIGFYLPIFARKNYGPGAVTTAEDLKIAHVRAAVHGAREMLRVTGHNDPGGPWLPVGVGVHTGLAFFGTVVGAEGSMEDFTALGDNVNIAARLASAAGPGEAIISEAAYTAAGLDLGDLEQRELQLKGRQEPVRARVLRSAAALATG